MKKHTKIYLAFFDYVLDDYIACEVCNSKAVDIHHIECRGMGGSLKNDIYNLMALCRKCHIKYGDKKQYKDWLQEIHNEAIKKQTT